MLELTYKGDLKVLVREKNIASLLSKEDLGKVGALCLKELGYDLTARTDWDSTYAEAMKLALQVVEEKTFPWENCANVKLPLLTVAALNFHARAFASLINGAQVVEYNYQPKPGEPEPSIRENDLKALRITKHQNYQMLSVTDWEQNEDKALLVTPIMGCSFKKSHYDNDKKTNVSRLILPQNLVVPYYTASLDTTPRISELFELVPNAFTTQVRRGYYLDIEYSPSYRADMSAMELAKYEAQHVTPVAYPDGAPSRFVEQHRYLDLDGDGYSEPYIVTFVRETGQVCRIVARFEMPDVEMVNGKVAFIHATHYYTKKPFIPSPDGGFYDMGLGMLLGPTNHAVDSLINQLLDAGTMQTLGGGFIGRGVRIRRGENTFAPYEWKSVDSPGGVLRDNIVPLPTREPSQVLLDLLMFLVQWGERIGSANEIQMGEIPGQNVKAETMQIANTNGQRVYAAIFKRWWKSTKEECSKLYKLTRVHIRSADAVILHAGGAEPSDYDLPAEYISPVADPNVSSPEEQQKQATLVYNTALQTPGTNVHKALLRLYKAYNVKNAEEIAPDPAGPDAIPPQPDAKIIDAQSRALVAQATANKMRLDMMLAIAKMQSDVQKTNAEIIELLAKAEMERAKASGEHMGKAIALIDAEIAAHKTHNEGLLATIKMLQAIGAANDAGTGQDKGSGSTESSGSAGETGEGGEGTGLSSMEGGASDTSLLRLPASAA